jgi:hypothetical protein
MTGFKEGASADDPLADDEQESDQQANRERTIDEDPETGRESPGRQESQSMTLPWLYERNSITDGRARTVQLHLQQSTLDQEHDALRDVPINETVQKADLREAAYLVGLQHLDAVAAQLEDWGYDFE